jgi:putative heme iron utilization protein
LTRRAGGVYGKKMTAAPAPPAATTARWLLRSLDRASLATSFAGAPYVSLVLAATAPDGAPLLLLSDLAQHTVNIAADPRIALLFDGTAGHDEPLTGPRVTLLGRVERSDDARLRGRFLARHPGAALYAGFADFRLYRIAVARAHLIAGFGRIDWIEADALLPPGLGALAVVEDDIVRHMNDDHADAVALYANRLLGRPGEGWTLTGIDAEGVDLRRGGAIARLAFAAPVGDAAAARAALIGLANEARAR